MYGEDSDELLRKLALNRGVLELIRLRLTTLPDLPEGITELNCCGTPLTSLPTLPSTLKVLNVHGTQIKELPTLPAGLERLFCGETLLTSLPALPDSLELLNCEYTMIAEVPELPEKLKYFITTQCLLLPQRVYFETPIQYINRIKELGSKKRIQARTRLLFPDLMAAAWHPRRVEAWLAIGGLELLESM